MPHTASDVHDILQVKIHDTLISVVCKLPSTYFSIQSTNDLVNSIVDSDGLAVVSSTSCDNNALSSSNLINNSGITKSTHMVNYYIVFTEPVETIGQFIQGSKLK